jgi:cytochrome c biogenesis protein CcdA
MLARQPLCYARKSGVIWPKANEDNKMQNYYLDIFSAFWLGVLTSISPCPLATNIAAISFVARNMGSSRKILWSGVLYSVGSFIAAGLYLLLKSILGFTGF